MKISNYFTLEEMTHSQSAEREGGEMLEQQKNPSQQVKDNLTYLCKNTLDEIRSRLDTPMFISSGYRGPLLNQSVGSSIYSQHLQGEAADCNIHSLNPQIRKFIEDQVQVKFRGDVTPSYLMFIFCCLNLEQLDIDQVIHEYGSNGQPAWVHVASSKRANRREIKLINPSGNRTLTLKEAIELGI